MEMIFGAADFVVLNRGLCNVFVCPLQEFLHNYYVIY